MTARRRAKIIAAIAAIAMLAFAVFALRMASWMPLALSGAVFVGVLLALWPNPRRPDPPPLPDGVARADYKTAIENLDEGARKLQNAARKATPDDRLLFERMADLLQTIRAHHVANPSHVQRTRTFVRHSLGRMVGAVEDYGELSARTGPDQRHRLADISKQLESFVPALEKIDQACIDNDVMALEISVEVLNDQLDRDR
jgi:5-bromo-4-chloroindolyl phosphate hydrolysis protein